MPGNKIDFEELEKLAGFMSVHKINKLSVAGITLECAIFPADFYKDEEEQLRQIEEHDKQLKLEAAEEEEALARFRMGIM